MILLKILFGFIFILNGGNDSNDIINSYLKKNLSEYKKFEYELISLPGGLNKFDSKKLEIDFTRSFKGQNGFGFIPVTLDNGKRGSTNGVVTLRLKLYQDVFVASRDLKRYTVLSEGDFIIQEKDVTGQKYLPSPEISFSDEQYRLKANLSANEILLVNHFEKVPLVKIGSRVEAIFVKSNVEISFPATAREDGRLGEVIRITREDKRILNAEIISPSQVKIVE